ncbi:hypothetical protein CIB95_03665 [Lottiidibacillus patelloidae]|uniref:Nucleotidyl transferase AbiEii/AbiGii toxin family protein n=1 Tax=Lottiidibacillus patelloidae TaxID=2670334 RepID=A0A263BYI3_9BACI|nr:hypothetical protein [Lottiidibacillus patelloidae]OZM58678.1 hypothetical protein CIB95_03665 [Lottiidibacillus patelloidae]
MNYTLSQIAKVLNEKNVTWAVGGSYLLRQYNLCNVVRDLDIFVAEEDIHEALKQLDMLGEGKKGTSKLPYGTEFFYNYVIADTSIDVMAKFKVFHEEGEYEHPFSSQSVNAFICIEGERIPLMEVTDWYVLYQLIPRRDEKVKAIERYFHETAPPNSVRLAQLSNAILPKKVKENIAGYL